MLSLRQRQVLIFIVMFVSYMSVYFGRINLSVASPLMLSEGVLSSKQFGALLSVGTLLYASGKFSSGAALKYIGPRYTSTGALLLAAVSCMLFPYGTSFQMLLLWCSNRFAQSFLWTCDVALCAKWYPAAVKGKVIAVLVSSYLVADVFGRLFLGHWLKDGHAWETVFLITAVPLLGGSILSFLFLKNEPDVTGESDLSVPLLPESRRQRGHRTMKQDVKAIMSLKEFWILAFLSTGGCFLREILRDWSVMFLTEHVGVTTSEASFASSCIPFTALISTLLIGIVGDRFPRHRGVVMLPGVLIAVCSSLGLLYCTYYNIDAYYLTLFCLCSMSFGGFGVYNMISLLSIDLCARQGLVDSIGVFESLTAMSSYVLSASGGVVLAHVIHKWGWISYVMILCFTVASMLALILYYVINVERKYRHTISGDVPVVNV